MTLATWHTDNNFDKFFDMEPLFVTKNEKWIKDEETLLPKVNLIENENSYHLEAETPGMMEKDISVEVHNGILKVDLPIHEQVKPQKIQVTAVS